MGRTDGAHMAHVMRVLMDRHGPSALAMTVLKMALVMTVLKMALVMRVLKVALVMRVLKVGLRHCEERMRRGNPVRRFFMILKASCPQVLLMADCKIRLRH
jgi:hypothetical protein